MSAEGVRLDPEIKERLADKATRLEILAATYREAGEHKVAKERAQVASDIRAALAALTAETGGRNEGS